MWFDRHFPGALRESKHRWAGHLARRRDNRSAGQSESQNGYVPMEIKDLEADLEQDGATI